MRSLLRNSTLETVFRPFPSIPAEIFKVLTTEARDKLLTMCNNLWGREDLPHTLNESTIAAIYKTGKDPREYANYRPIALLNVTCKLLAKMLQIRLLEILDSQLVPQQFGFRPGKSTAGKSKWGLSKWGLRALVHNCPRLPTIVIILRRKSPLIRKGPKKATKVHNCRRFCANCREWP